MTAAELNSVVKTQKVRQLDVWLLGPLMVWGGLALAGRVPRESPVAGTILAVCGVLTILYNGYNYRTIERARQG